MPNHKFSVVIPLSTTFQPRRHTRNEGEGGQRIVSNIVSSDDSLSELSAVLWRVLYKHICVICKWECVCVCMCVWITVKFCLSFRFLKLFLMQQFGLPCLPCLLPIPLPYPICFPPPLFLSLSLPLSALHSCVLSSEMRDLCGDLRATQKWTCVNLCALQAQKMLHTHTHMVTHGVYKSGAARTPPTPHRQQQYTK